MNRCLAAFSVFLVAGSALASEPTLRLQIVSVQGDTFVVEETTLVPQQRAETRTRVVNGRQEQYVVTVQVNVPVVQKINYRLPSVGVYEANGTRCSPAQVRELLRKPRAVVIADSAKLSKEMREILKDDALVVVLPPVEP